MRTPSEKLKERWLKALLDEVETRGWTRGALHRAAETAGLSEGEQALAAPNGVNDLIDHFFDKAAEKTRRQLGKEDLDALRVHERVARGLRVWLDVLEPDKVAVRRAAGRGLLPWGAGAATRRIWRIADVIWEAAGDTATDYNRQTKRALLSAVIPDIVLRWLATADQDKIDALIMRRLKQAMKLGQAGGKVLKPVLDAVEARRKPKSET